MSELMKVLERQYEKAAARMDRVNMALLHEAIAAELNRQAVNPPRD